MRMYTVLLAMLAAIASPITAANDRPFADPVSFTTLAITPFAIEGLTGDEFGNLYTTGRAPLPDRCPMWQIAPGGGLPLQIGSIGNAAPGCNANERNAIVVVTRDRDVVEIFRNPLNASGLRNAADPVVGNDHILELPTSPFLSGRRLCVAQSDGNRRDNSPNGPGEINSSGPVGARGKISCMDQALNAPDEHDRD